jgi:hypothetical protein
MLTWFSEKVEQAQQILNAQNIQLGFKFNPLATQGDIHRCEEELRVSRRIKAQLA